MLGTIKNIFKPEKIVLNNGKEIQPKTSVTPFVIIGLILALIVAGNVTGFNFETIMKRGNQFFVILKDMFPPDLNYMKTVVAPLIETVKISVLGSLIGSFIAIPFAMLCSVNINKSKVVLNLVRVVMSITRTLPTLIIALIYMYVGSEMGQEMLLRTEEFSTEGASGFTRVVGGYLMFDQLTFDEQIIGIPDARNRFGIEMYDGNFIFYANGVQTILLSLGYIGALLYGLFYIILFRNTNLVSRMCIIILFVMGLLESNYLNPYMMLLTIIPCADYHFTRNRLRV